MKKLWIHSAIDIVSSAALLVWLGTGSVWAVAICGGTWVRLMLVIHAVVGAAKYGTTAELASLSITDIIKRGTRPSVESLHSESVERQLALRDLLSREAARLRATAQRQANETGKTHAYQVVIGDSLTFETVDPEVAS